MIQDIWPHVLRNEFVAGGHEPEDTVICEHNGCVLARISQQSGNLAQTSPEAGTVSLPRVCDFPLTPDLAYGFSIDDQHFYVALNDEVTYPEGFGFEPIRVLRNALPQHLGFAGALGAQLSQWYRANRFCGACGEALELAPDARELRCPACKNIVYPKISPAVIVGLTCGDKLLLTKYAGREYTRHALVAGYVEVGETLEECVAREVMEEVGLRVAGTRYYKSQPWPFSSSLLVGFYAEVEPDPITGEPPEPTVDMCELKEAEWFCREDLPEWGDRASLTSEMIREYRLGRQ